MAENNPDQMARGGGQGTVTAAKVLADACLSVQEEVDAEWEKLQKETKCG